MSAPGVSIEVRLNRAGYKMSYRRRDGGRAEALVDSRWYVFVDGENAGYVARELVNRTQGGFRRHSHWESPAWLFAPTSQRLMDRGEERSRKRAIETLVQIHLNLLRSRSTGTA